MNDRTDKNIRILTWMAESSDRTTFEMKSSEMKSSEAASSETASSGAASSAATSIEAFLRAKGCSHHVLTHLKRTDHGILLNGEWTYANQRVHPGDTVSIRVEETEPTDQILPVPLPLTVVYEDEDLLILDKPSDMPVHPSAGNYENTLANAVMYYYASKGIPFVFRCVTRLDRDTTGLVVVAKNMFSGAVLSKMSSERMIHREYLAITEGHLPACGTVDAPIARLENSALMRHVDAQKGERAVTHYRTLGYYHKSPEKPHASDASGCMPAVSTLPQEISHISAGMLLREIPPASIRALPQEISLASVRLETGRTHQIRVHMKYIGHPLPGDFLYDPESVCALTPRQMLHSHRIRLAHPVTGKSLDFESELPPDMRQLLDCYVPSG